MELPNEEKPREEPVGAEVQLSAPDVQTNSMDLQKLAALMPVMMPFHLSALRSLPELEAVLQNVLEEQSRKESGIDSEEVTAHCSSEDGRASKDVAATDPGSDSDIQSDKDSEEGEGGDESPVEITSSVVSHVTRPLRESSEGIERQLDRVYSSPHRSMVPGWQEKMRKEYSNSVRRKASALEILTSEHSYVKSLGTIVEVFSSF